MARLTFLWHLHQPLYRTADGTVHAPWVLLHAAGEYLTLVHALEKGAWRGHVINLTPVFLEQLTAYRDGTAHDPLLEGLRTPARELAPAGQHELVRWASFTHPRQLSRWPRLAELNARVAGAAPAELPRRLTVQDLSDLQVLLILAYAWPNLAWEPELAELAGGGRGYSEAARRTAVGWLEGCPRRLLEAYRRLAGQEGIEVSTSPLTHPIVPLLLDTTIVAESWAPRPAPPAPVFTAPSDAAEQVRSGLATARAFGFSPLGCWPPEGAVSEAAVRLYGQHGVRWLATDEGILSSSLNQPLTGETGVGGELFRTWRLAEDGPAIFFRHRGLSDFISFQAPRSADENEAARELAAQLRRLANALPDDAGILLALDGENPWTGYPEGGTRFLASLARELQGSAQLAPVTLSWRAAHEQARALPRLHPGSWIGGVFATWIGHSEKNRAWELLARVQGIVGSRGGLPWLAAQGSDWWWWLGDDNPTPLAPLYDELFRAHLRDACTAAGVPPPPELAAPIRSASTPLRVPLSREWPPPALNGRTTSFFEWAVAVWVEAPASHRFFARAALRSDENRLWLRVEARPGVGPPAPLVLTLVTGQRPTATTLPADVPHDCAVGSVLEAALPLPEAGTLLALEHQGERLPAEGFWRLEFEEVDES